MRQTTVEDKLRLQNLEHLAEALRNIQPGEQVPYYTGTIGSASILKNAQELYREGKLELVQERRPDGSLLYWAIGRHVIKPLKEVKVHRSHI